MTAADAEAPSRPCPCGAGRPFSDCCGRYVAGSPAPTAQALMRSRYTAFGLGRADYLAATWHPSTRPADLNLTGGPEWIGLEIVHCQAGGEADLRGRVEFIARYRQAGRPGRLHETSRFLRENGRWYYLDGTLHAEAAAREVGRNAACPCGSGRKYKRCCGGRGA